jgi:heat shock protein HtpX
MSKSAAKRSMGVEVIEHPSNDQEEWLVNTVKRQAQSAGIGMPEVGIFQSDGPNAFATGANRNHALVAVSSGLLDSMTREEAEAVMGHEISHVANGDMITMTLLQGILNAFVLFISRIIGFVMSSNSKGHGGGVRAGNFIGTMIAQFVLGFLAALIIKWFSRYREFHADAGGARLSGNMNMINALKALQRVSDPVPLKGQFVGFGVSGVKSTVAKLFSTHPPLEDRIAALEKNDYL